VSGYRNGQVCPGEAGLQCVPRCLHFCICGVPLVSLSFGSSRFLLAVWVGCLFPFLKCPVYGLRCSVVSCGLWLLVVGRSLFGGVILFWCRSGVGPVRMGEFVIGSFFGCAACLSLMGPANLCCAVCFARLDLLCCVGSVSPYGFAGFGRGCLCPCWSLSTSSSFRAAVPFRVEVRCCCLARRWVIVSVRRSSSISVTTRLSSPIGCRPLGPRVGGCFRQLLASLGMMVPSAARPARVHWLLMRVSVP